MAESLIEMLSLEPIEVNLFRGRAPQGQGPRIFGGLVIAQALLAAYRTVETRLCHSLHCYFIRPGDPAVPILYEVDRARDGRSFTTRRVTAIQHGEQIFNLAASFQDAEPGAEHQDPMPDLPTPDVLLGDPRQGDGSRPIEIKPVEKDWGAPGASSSTQNIWMRAVEDLGEDPVLNQAVIAYASDMSFLSTSMRPHGWTWQTPGLQSASLDHVIWFHRPSRFNDWHLYAQRSPSSSGARGMNLGAVYHCDGTLVATTAQEGLIRRRPPKG
ncbi:MAG: acyl-CoA thioesterase II [Alphaproteobacteria bacterium]|jgi:acyl-CoA thioesterase-2|nr:acyl-CoA thioesterase II [Alphaproteobacteria bacterium]